MPFDPSQFDPSIIPFTQIAFFALTLFTLGGALGVVFSQNLFHSALYLILSLFGVAGYFALLSSGFLAVVQLMVYVGAIAILILFAIMFSRSIGGSGQSQDNPLWWFTLPISFILFLILMAVNGTVEWPVDGSAPEGDTVFLLGEAFLGGYLIPFMVVSILLSVALIGAIFLAREKTEAEEAQ